jgi:hypothetical protein
MIIHFPRNRVHHHSTSLTTPSLVLIIHDHSSSPMFIVIQHHSSSLALIIHHSSSLVFAIIHYHSSRVHHHITHLLVSIVTSLCSSPFTIAHVPLMFTIIQRHSSSLVLIIHDLLSCSPLSLSLLSCSSSVSSQFMITHVPRVHHHSSSFTPSIITCTNHLNLVCALLKRAADTATSTERILCVATESRIQSFCDIFLNHLSGFV